MPRRLAQRCVGVTYLKGLQGENERLEFKLAAAPQDGALPPPLYQTVRSQTLEREREQVDDCVRGLIEAARAGQPRGAIDLEAALAQLAQRLLPDTGMAPLFWRDRRSHPWLEVCPPALADLPWEGLPETYRECRNPQCPHCGKPMSVGRGVPDKPGHCECGAEYLLRRHILSFRRHVAHLVRVDDPLPLNQGRRFLIIANPTGDLFETKAGHGENEAGVFCRQHVAELRRMLLAAGYEVELLRESAATVANVLEYLRRPQLVGVYYFGHGFLEDGGAEGCLVLHGRGRLYASEIQQEAPRCPFVFLNACHGAAAGRAWGFDKSLRSVAQAFADRGEGKVVIAPIWPISGRQAAEFALDFFRRAVRGARLPLALRSARRRSYRKYHNNEPAFGWAAYRYFGLLERSLPKPWSPPPPQVEIPSRVFGADDELRIELFSCPLDDILLRAAKRRNLQRRRRVTRADVLAGLLRCGELTRFAVRALGEDPDALYEQLGKLVEFETPEPPGAGQPPPPAAGPRPAVEADPASRWQPRRREEFLPPAAALFEQAEKNFPAREAAPEASPEQPAELIAEEQLLAALLASGAWDAASLPKLPAAASVSRLVFDPAARGHLDANGGLLLNDLDPSARKVVKNAHALAQLRGLCPIPARLMFVGFLLESQGYAARLCQSQNVHADSLCAVLMALMTGAGPKSFRLGDHACSRIVKPMLERVRRTPGLKPPFDETALFRAFCAAAPPDFHDFLRSLPSPCRLDLNAALRLDGAAPGEAHGSAPPTARSNRPGGSGRRGDSALEWDGDAQFPQPSPLPPPGGGQAARAEQFEPEAWRRVALAAAWARLQHWREIRSPHLFVALLGDGAGWLASATRRAGLELERAKILVLSLTSRPPAGSLAGADEQSLLISQRVADILTRAVERARRDDRAAASCRDIEEAFLVDGGGVVGELFQKLRLQLKPWWNNE